MEVTFLIIYDHKVLMLKNKKKKIDERRKVMPFAKMRNAWKKRKQARNNSKEVYYYDYCSMNNIL